MVEIQFDIVSLEFGSRYILMNTTQSSFENMDNFTLPTLPAILSYSNARDRPLEDRYMDADSIGHAFSVFEGVETI